MVFCARNFRFDFPRSPLVMGILNVTPDSFSDGGHFLTPPSAIAYGIQMVENGADCLDVGGESTRPGAIPVEEQEEMDRILPVIFELSRQTNVPISCDTSKPRVAKAALEAGASIINNVAGNRDEIEMWQTVSRFGAGYVLMHNRGTPATMQSLAVYDDVRAEVEAFLANRMSTLVAAGIPAENILLDPGIGFAKTSSHNLTLLRNIRSFTRLQRPLLVGVSRKSFIGNFGKPGAVDQRLGGSLACAVWSVLNGVQVIRTHDVFETTQALAVLNAIEAQKK
ncbi:MAG: dihydropteroate synthase [Verrucomicrobiales bacterium]|nr:dihydropteroate synthase [Verrucomicrobiales bacterium]